MLVLGGRGTGKSYLSALDTHLTSLLRAGARHADPRRQPGAVGAGLPGPARIREPMAREKGSQAIRGDAEGRGGLRERLGGRDPGRVDHQRARAARPQPEARRGRRDRRRSIREAAMGMCMDRQADRQRGESRRRPCMTSTWHRHDGPMARLIEQAEAGTSRSTRCASSRSSSAAPRSGRAEVERLREVPGLPADQATAIERARRAIEPQGEAVERPLPDRLADPEAADDQHADVRGRLPLQGPEGRRRLVPELLDRDPRQ